MCVAAIAWQAHPRWKLVAIGNRDEFHARPTAPLQRWADGRIIAGRDLQAGGTWLGVADGRFALVTNRRADGYPDPALASRGALVTDWLRGSAPGNEPMNPFNLWLAAPEQLEFVSNFPDSTRQQLVPGIHGLSNGARADRWFKTVRLETALAGWLAKDSRPDALFDPLADQTRDPADAANPFSAVFIRDARYGTRCSSVVAVDAEGRGTIIERSFDSAGAATGTVALEFGWA